MHEFKTIVLPIDFSRYCEGAAAYASWIASRSGATIHVVHVIVKPCRRNVRARGGRALGPRRKRRETGRGT